MAENRTKPTDASVEAYLGSRADAQQGADCQDLMAILGRVTGAPPVMWGPTSTWRCSSSAPRALGQPDAHARPVRRWCCRADEVQLRVCPTTRGRGTHVFQDRRDLRIIEARTFDNGVVLLRYEMKKR